MESLVTQNVMHASLCYMISSTFQGGYSAMSTASRRALLGSRRVLYPSKLLRENTECVNELDGELTRTSTSLTVSCLQKRVTTKDSKFGLAMVLETSDEVS